MTQRSSETSPPRKERIRRVLRRVFHAIIILIAALAIYAWVTGARQEAIETGEPHMKAVVYTEYGSPDVLQIRDIKKPVPNDDEILVKVHAASVNPLDWHFIRGTPFIGRLGLMGLRKPKVPRLGVDYAGTVEAVGKNVRLFKPGDKVFGGKTGAFAEYLCTRADRAVTVKPANVTFQQAASVPIAGVTALQGLRDKGHVQPGQKVLINGASGGVGTFAVQLAKLFGGEVTGVCSTRNLELVRSLGAEHVIDYTKEDFTKGKERYDVILDNVGNQPLSGFRRALNSNGILVMIGGGGPNDGGLIGPMGRPVKALLMSPFTSQKMGMFMAELTKGDLTTLGDLMQTGKVTPVIDRTYPLREIADAIRYLEEGHARGKVVINVGDSDGT
ncbi:MAG TPA: NAD(P)-dependent alcohol dehydrogenase [Chthoniobacterales bacterium]|nr:NAD(P)-dependent alcohol dehydrogenase [Chthoniobacterales bacterium]